jgi:hypothetical protein
LCIWPATALTLPGDARQIAIADSRLTADGAEVLRKTFEVEVDPR